MSDKEKWRERVQDIRGGGALDDDDDDGFLLLRVFYGEKPTFFS